MVQVFTELCTETGLEWTSAESGAETFVTLSRKGVVAIMKSLGSKHFVRPPGTRELYIIK